jgi:predicted Zn-dependent protease with MMP-like domain
MTADYFDELIAAAIERLPPEFRAQLDSVGIVVDDYPTPFASKITLFRGPLEAYSSSAENLGVMVEETLFHEIGHHLGISDARLAELEQERRQRRQQN